MPNNFLDEDKARLEKDEAFDFKWPKHVEDEITKGWEATVKKMEEDYQEYISEVKH